MLIGTPLTFANFQMTAKDLISFIHKVVPNSLDFLYLRIDFANQCNVG